MATSIKSGFRLIIGDEIVSHERIHSWAQENLNHDLEWISSIAQFLLNWFNQSDILIVKTSGSTGKPKDISIQKSKMIVSASKTNQFFNLTTKSTALLALSTNYIAGKMMLVRALIGGYTIYAIEPQANPLSAISTPIDFAPLVPMQVLPFLNVPNSINTILLGGAPVSPQYFTTLEHDTNTNYFLSFGMTETVSHIALRALNGKNASPYFKCVSGVSVSTTSNQELVIDAPDLLNTPLKTNDVVSLKNEYEFKWLGRADFVINSGGVKIHPEEVETKIAPYIDFNFFVWKEEDEILHERVVLLIENSNKKVIINEIEWYKSLHPFEKPKTVYVVPSFCYTETGKVKRNDTYQLALDERNSESSIT